MSAAGNSTESADVAALRARLTEARDALRLARPFVQVAVDSWYDGPRNADLQNEARQIVRLMDAAVNGQSVPGAAGLVPVTDDVMKARGEKVLTEFWFSSVPAPGGPVEQIFLNLSDADVKEIAQDLKASKGRLSGWCRVGAEPVAWQERQARRLNRATGEIIEWSNWYECKPRVLDAPRSSSGEDEGTLIPYEWRPLSLYASPRSAGASEAAGIELAAQWVEKRLEDYDDEHIASEGYVGELNEIIRGIRALAATPERAAAKVPQPDWFCEEHPDKAMGHDGCGGAGILACEQVERLALLLRLSRHEVRETAMHRDDLFCQMRAAAKVPPKGHALVPLRLTPAMNRVLETEGWQWEDLLAEAGAITEKQYDEIALAAFTLDEIGQACANAGISDSRFQSLSIELEDDRAQSAAQPLVVQKSRAATEWNHVDDVLAVIEQARAGNWSWLENTQCKYLELRVDMRDGGCIVKDRQGNRITPEALRKQIGGHQYDAWAPVAPAKP